MGVIRETVLRLLKENRKQGAITVMKMIGLDGGEGSGNFGHAGRPGEVGGSAPEKGGGSGGSGEKTVAMNERVFKGIAVKARKNPDNMNKFLASLSQTEAKALHEQHKRSGSQENVKAYAERMYRMMASSPEPKHENKVVNGKDITKDYEWDSEAVYTNEFGQQIDKQIEDVLEKQGFMGVPKVVDSDEFDRIIKEHREMPVLFRSYTAPNEQALEDYDKQLEGGEWYVDCGVGGAEYGQGMYCAGMYIAPPKKWDEEGAFDPQYETSYVIGADGKTYDCDSGEECDDYWMEDGQIYILSKYDENGKVKSSMVKVQDKGDKDFDLHDGKKFLDMENGELHDLQWLLDNYKSGYGEGSKMMQCEEVDADKPYEIDYSGTYEEMRHYRNLNEKKLNDNYIPPVPEGKGYGGYNQDGIMEWFYYDPKDKKSFKEEKPEPGDIICVGKLDDTKVVKYMYYVRNNGTLLELGTQQVKRPEEIDYWDWAKAEGRLNVGDFEPKSSTRRMTLDPSAKIIDYSDIQRMADGGLSKEEKKRVNRGTFDDLCEKYGVTNEVAKEVFWSDITHEYPPDSVYEKYMGIEKHDEYEDKRRKVFLDWAKEAYEKEKAIKQERAKLAKKFDDYGSFAAALGYDAINAGGHGKSGSYTVVLNRSKVILDKKRIPV